MNGNEQTCFPTVNKMQRFAVDVVSGLYAYMSLFGHSVGADML